MNEETGILGDIIQDDDLAIYPHDKQIESAIKKLDKACAKRCCDDCPLSLGFMISHDLRDEPTECVAMLLTNLYKRYQIDHQTMIYEVNK